MENSKYIEFKEIIEIHSRITCLEYENEEHQNKIINLEKDNQELKKIIIFLENKINIIENKINDF